MEKNLIIPARHKNDGFEPYIKDLIRRNEKNLKQEGVEVEFTNCGLRMHSQTGNAISTLILVNCQILNVEKRQYHTYECVILHDKNFKYEKILIHENEFLQHDTTWLCKMLGLKFAGSEENLEIIYSIMKKSAFLAEENKIYNYTGWLKDAELSFIYADAKIDRLGWHYIENKQKCLSINGINEKQACEFIKNTYLNVLTNTMYSRILLCYEILSALKLPFSLNGKVICFTLYIYGETGTGKTSISFTMLNSFEIRNISVNDTEASALEIVDENKGGVTIIDDFKTNKNRKFKQIVEDVLRIAGDETTSARRKVGNTVIEVHMDNLAAITAEIEPPFQTSSFPRLLILKFDRATVNVDNLRDMECDIEGFKRNNIAFILHLLKFVVNTPDKIQQFCMQYDEEIKRQRSLTKGLHGRYYNILAWMNIAWKIISEFCESCGVYLEDGDFDNKIREMVVNQHKRYSPKSSVVMFCEALFYLIDRRVIKVINNEDIHKKEGFDIIVRDGIYQIRTRIVFEKIQQFYQSQDIDFAYSEQSVRNDLLKYGLILKSKKKGTTTTDDRKIGKHTFSYFSFCRKAAENFLKESNENE